MKHLLQLDVLIQDTPQPGLVSAITPSLARLLDGAGDITAHETTAAEWMLNAFGVESAAPYSAAGDGLEVAGGYWLRADPVHLHLLRDRIILPSSSMDDLDMEEAQALLQILNAHFGELHFYAPVPQRWYVRAVTRQPVLTSDPARVAGQDIRSHLPQGEHGNRWMSRLNEAQMLLHEHPVNVSRETRGKLPVNGLWLWGGGVWQAPGRQPYGQCWGNDALLKGLADQSNPLPRSVHALLACPTERQLLVLTPGPHGGDLEAQWFAPLCQALRSGRLAQLRLLLAQGGRMAQVTLRRRDLWKFWRAKTNWRALLEGR